MSYFLLREVGLVINKIRSEDVRSGELVSLFDCVDGFYIY